MIYSLGVSNPSNCKGNENYDKLQYRLIYKKRANVELLTRQRYLQ